jgi:hypothetical protein
MRDLEIHIDRGFRSFQNIDKAHQFLQELAAPLSLIIHVQLVAEAAEILISKFHELKIDFDADFIRLGVTFHDAGKILHPEELTDRGNNHEIDGERFLIANGIDPKLARCCLSHARWQTMECSFEELCIALADTLWKGKRNPQLEESIVKILADRSSRDYWDIFIEIDSCFEAIANDGVRRLLRSKSV